MSKKEERLKMLRENEKRYSAIQVLKIVKAALDNLFHEIDEKNQEILRVLEEELKKDVEKVS